MLDNVQNIKYILYQGGAEKMATCASAFIVWANPREIIEYEHDVHGEIVLNEDGSKKILSSTPSFLAELTEQEICDTVLNMWVNSKPGRIGAVIYCVSKSDFHHLHMVLEVENSDSDRFTFKQVQKLYGKKFHIEPTRGSKKEAEDYIYKRGKYAEKDERILAFAQYGEIQGNQGKRTDLKTMEEMLERGMTPQQIMDEIGLAAYKYKAMLRDAYMRKCEIETGTYREVKVYYHTGESWSGKSYVMRQLEAERGAENIYKVANYKRGCWDKYEGQKILFMDELRPYSMTYATLLSILNSYVLDIDARYDNKKMMWTEVHITSVLPPEELYKQMVDGVDRQFDTYAQLKNRITYVVYHWHDDTGYHTFEQSMNEYHGYNSIKFQAIRNPDSEGFAKMDDSEIRKTEAIFEQTRIAGT